MSVGSLPIRRKCSWMRRISSTLSASPILSLSCASCGAEASPRTTSYRGNGADRRTNRSSIPVPPERTNGGATLCFSYGRERRAEWKLQVARCAHAGAMRRPFRASLASTPLVLEIVPPSRRASEKAVSNLVDRVRDAVGSSGRLDGLNLPQVLEENHQGQPFLRNMDPRDFVQRLGGDLGVDPIVNDVVAHMPSGPAFRRWVEESLDRFGLRSFVLVGGTNSRIRYPGPSVLEANGILRSVAEGHEVRAWLGASVTPRTEEALAASDERSLGRSSLELARTLWSHLSAAALQSRPAVPLGVNIEEVSLHNFDLAVQMARDFPSWREAKSPRADHV